ncbi:MAG: excinuclease ABC subunit UvrA [Bacteroidia bacterium]|nr:excinuclease ABC subunit UvrA [Bacteroidia bacterium]
MSKKDTLSDEILEIEGARVHNLRNLHVTIPRGKLVVITGLSGSGKSSLAFDTIFAEGQRRYIETFSSYARQFLGGMERPDVDKINGLSPVISIEQKTVNRNPRSTVGTITEVYDFMRLLFARAADAYSYVTGEKMVRYSTDQIIDLIAEHYRGKKIVVLAPVVKGRKGHYRELFDQIRKYGFTRVRVDGEMKDMTVRMQVDRYKIHDIEIVIDRLPVEDIGRQRIVESVNLAMKHGKGSMMIGELSEKAPGSDIYKDMTVRHFSKFLMCPTSGISYDEPAPNLFSFNSPYGACTQCNGLGNILEIDIHKIIPDRKKSLKQGGITPLGEYKNNWIWRQVEAIADSFKFKLNGPVDDIPEEALQTLLYGSDRIFKVKGGPDGTGSYTVTFEGIVNILSRQEEESGSESILRWVQGFMNEIPCPTCLGSRIKKEAHHFRVLDKNIAELADMNLLHLSEWFLGLEKKLDTKKRMIATEILKEINNRIRFLLDVGLDYITLNRSSRTLSGGEAQRIRLATQIGSQLVGVLYILDEPSIGLHQRDNTRLIHALKELRDIGNSVLVVEHDKEMILSADHILDIGPMAGIHGGAIVAQGSPAQIRASDSLTAQYLNGKKKIDVPQKRRKGNGKKLRLEGARGHNLKSVMLEIELGTLTCITGVSGSGKSSLVGETLFPILNKHFNRAEKRPLPYSSIRGLEYIDKVIEIDQSPIGRTPRSNPATYTNVFSDIRNLFTLLPEAKIRGYKPGRFSFNVKGGRCEACQGAGLKTIEMNFLPDVYVHCEECQGKRYNRETLEVRYKGKSISDVLNMTIEQAVSFFESIPFIAQRINTLSDVGLGYITLGQPSTTLSGGEAQRIKLATELSKRDTGNTLYILDEPTTGLHFEDIRILLHVLNRLVEKGNTVVIIEHNMDMIKVADRVIDIGPEGGEKGGRIVCQGTPEDIIRNKESYTAKYLKPELV